MIRGTFTLSNISLLHLICLAIVFIFGSDDLHDHRVWDEYCKSGFVSPATRPASSTDLEAFLFLFFFFNSNLDLFGMLYAWFHALPKKQYAESGR